MNSTAKIVKVIYKNKEILSRIEYDLTNLELNLFVNNNKYTEDVTDRDFLAAFNRIRKKLGDDYLFLCNGARKNIIRSGMMLASSAGLWLYTVENGIVDSGNPLMIFDNADASKVSTLADQEKFTHEILKKI